MTHEPYTITFTQTFDFAPRFFARMATYRGTDSSQVRTGEPPNTKTVSVHVEEESCTDTEMNHAPEIVDYFVLDSRGYDGVSAQGTGGVLYAKSNLNRGCEGLYDATAAQLSGGAFFDSQETNPNTDLTGGEAGDQVGLASINFAEGDETATWQMDRCLAGHYTIVFSYGLASGDRPMSVSVNDEVVDGFMAMPETGSWSSYREVRVAARLKAGRNRITLSTIGFSGPNLDYMAVIPIGSNAAGDTVTIGESGVLQTIDYRDTTGYSQETNGGTPEEQWQTVHLTEAFVDPVVIIGTSTARGTQPTVPRLRNIVYSNPLGDYTDEANLATDDGCNGHCFDVRMQEPSCLDDLHLSEEIHYIVLEAGAWYTVRSFPLVPLAPPLSFAPTLSSTAACRRLCTDAPAHCSGPGQAVPGWEAALRGRAPVVRLWRRPRPRRRMDPSHLPPAVRGRHGISRDAGSNVQ